MLNQTKIEWTHATWNPVTGCSKISMGCQNCYAERIAKRLAGRYGYPEDNPFKVTLHYNRLQDPILLKKPHIIFVCSMGDLFHKDVPAKFILQVVNIIKQCPHHIFQILTKRERRLLKASQYIGRWPDNSWIGVTIEAKEYKYRMEVLKEISASIKFISCEPLLNSLGDLDLNGIDWVIVGGESGPKARPINVDWIKEIRDQCISNNVPFFFKQWGGFNKKRNGRSLEGIIWNQMPVVLNNKFQTVFPF